jgi:hypothetical protein
MSWKGAWPASERGAVVPAAKENAGAGRDVGGEPLCHSSEIGTLARVRVMHEAGCLARSETDGWLAGVRLRLCGSGSPYVLMLSAEDRTMLAAQQ